MSESKSDMKVWREIRAKLEEMGRRDAHVKVGVLQSAGSASSGGLSLAELAAIHEYGAPGAGIPERSFIRATFAARNDDLVKVTEKAARAVLSGRVTIEQALGLIGEWAAAAIKKTIKDRATTGPESQENSAETIRRKGSDLPLVDTGRLIDGISYEVVDK